MADEDSAVHAGTGAQSVETGVVRLYSVVVIVGGCAWAALDSLVSTVFPPLLWTRSRGMSAPPGPLSVVMGAKRPQPVLLSVRTAAARHHFQALDFLAHGFLEDGVGQEDQSVRAGVGVMVLASFAGAEYARLCGVHSSVPTFLWAGLRGASSPAGPILYPTPSLYRLCTIYANALY
jgi:hypothetical protein